MLCSTLKQQVALSQNLQVLSMADCGIKENTEEENEMQSCPSKVLIEIIELFSNSLVSLNLSYNELGSNFSHTFPKMRYLTKLSLKGCFENETEMIGFVNRIVAEQKLPIESL